MAVFGSLGLLAPEGDAHQTGVASVNFA